MSVDLLKDAPGKHRDSIFCNEVGSKSGRTRCISKALRWTLVRICFSDSLIMPSLSVLIVRFNPATDLKLKPFSKSRDQFPHEPCKSLKTFKDK